jgi:hypothetical protein
MLKARDDLVVAMLVAREINSRALSRGIGAFTMNNENSFEHSVSTLAAQSDAIGRLAQDAGGFAAVVAAFESRDAAAFSWVLDRLGFLPRCELICEWLRVKLSVLRCSEICGIPEDEGEMPTLQQFARAIVELASDEKSLRRVVDAVSCGNGDDYRSVVAELGLRPFCHLLCRWISTIIYRRVCEVVCESQPVLLADPAHEIQSAGRILAGLIADKRSFEAVGKAVIGLDCETLRSSLGQTTERGCEIICRFICTWRSVWVCREVCDLRPPVATVIRGVEEARSFALTAHQLAAQPRALGDLLNAVKTRDAAVFAGIVARFGLAPFCEQVCAWVSSRTCSELCTCICPSPELLPEFTAIGAYQYKTQIDSALPATGLTVGDTRAFFSTLRLNGILPQTLGGQPLEYRFEYQPIDLASTRLAAAITPVQTSISVASSVGFPTSGDFNVVIGGANGSYEILTVTLVSGSEWTVLRGQQGTLATAAAAGATIVTGTTASAAWTPVVPSQIARTVIGLWEHFVGGPDPIQTKIYTVNGIPGPDELVATFTADGWIQVPQMNDVNSASGAFFANGTMIELVSSSLAAFTAADETGVSAGNSANHPLATDLYFGIRMRVRQAGATTSSDGGTCSVVAIDNTLYDNVDHHPEWAGGIVNPEFAVYMLDIKELQAAGCAGITDSLTVLFTAAHPNLGPVSIAMTGPGGPYGFTLPTPLPETGNWFGTAENDFDLGTLTPCAYIVTLSVSLLLTTGDADFGSPLIDQIAFCLGPKNEAGQ